MVPVVVLLVSALGVVAPDARASNRVNEGIAKSEKSPGAASARAVSRQTGGREGSWVAVAAGPAFSFAQGPVWLRAQVRAGLPLMRFDERLALQLVLPLGFGWTRSTGAFASTSTAYGVDFVPLARLGILGPQRLRFYGDFGVGVVHYRYRFDLPSLGSGAASSTGLGIRVGAGVEYAFAPRWALFFEPLQLFFQTAQEGTFRFGNTSFTSSTGAGTQAQLAAGAQMRF